VFRRQRDETITPDLTQIMWWLMRLDAKLDRILKAVDAEEDDGLQDRD
jgi:hypothetical protein